jgi:hypothetical protein
MDKHADALNRVERQRLRDIEGALVQDDPDFAAAFADIAPDAEPASRSRPRQTVWLSIGGFLGVAVLAAGLVLAWPILGVLGFAMVVAAAWWLTQDGRVVSAFRSLVGLDPKNTDSPT